MLLSDLSQHSELLGLDLLAPVAVVSRMKAARAATSPSKIRIRVSEASDATRGRTLLSSRSGMGFGSSWHIEAATCRQGLTLSSRMNDDVVSLLRVRVEKPGYPLPAREAHGAALAHAGETFAEFTGACLEDGGASSPLQAAMFHAAILFAELHHVDHVVMQVAPDRAEHFAALMGMQHVSQADETGQSSCPTALLKLSLGFVRGQVRRHAGNVGETDYPMLYKWFFVAGEAAGVKLRIARLKA